MLVKEMGSQANYKPMTVCLSICLIHPSVYPFDIHNELQL